MPRQQQSSGEVRDWQLGQARAMFDLAFAKSDFYRARFQAAGVKAGDINTWEHFSKLPFIDKAAVIEDQRLNPPFGKLITTSPSSLKYIFPYAGPELVTYDETDWAECIRVTSQCPPYREVKKTDIVNITMSFHWVDAGFIQYATYRRRGAAVIAAGSGDSEKQIEIMRLTGATVISGFPTFIQRLAEKAKEMGVDPRADLSIRLAIVAGEMWSDTDRNAIEQTFGMETRQIYGSAELGGIAFECGCKQGMHVDPHSIVELLDPETGEPVPAGREGEIVVTSLAKKCQPMIRFRTYDITSGLDTSPCPCGLKTPRIGNIIGRSGNILRVRGLWVVPREVEEVVLRYPELGRFQAVVDRPRTMDVLTIRVARKQPCDAAALAESLKRDLKEKIRLSCEVEICGPESMPPDAKTMVDRRGRHTP